MNIHKFIPKIDKLEHAYVWTILFFVLSFSMVPLTNPDLALWIALGITIATAAGKEIVIDGILGKGCVEFLDFFFSILFPCLTMALYYLIKLF